MIVKSLTEYILKRLELDEIEKSLKVSGVRFDEAFNEVTRTPRMIDVGATNLRRFIPKHLRGPRP